ncbi:tetratricopeptide repeat protein [Flavicella sp.]|nr:tetratricopeptide repeat protein [Flavicella sp.]
MKNQLILLLSLSLSFGVVAQKKELKTAEKALKKKNYAASLDQLEVVSSLLENAAPKLIEKYYYLKAAALFEDGTNSAQEELAGEAYLELLRFQKESGMNKYEQKAAEDLSRIVQSAAAKGSTLYSGQKYKEAAQKFELVYTLSKKDTSYLEYAALASFYAKKYDQSISLYKKLLSIGYTGITTQYKATDALSGEDIYFNSQKEMDDNVKLEIASAPEVLVLDSRTNIANNIASSYSAKGDQDAALKAIDDAKKIFPNDYTLIISEANIFLKSGDNKKSSELFKKAIELKPNDAQLHFNVGVLTSKQGYAEEAISHFQNAIRLKPDYSDAYYSIGVLITEKETSIIEEMNKTSDFDRYDELLLKRKEVYLEALPYFEIALKCNEKSPEIMKTLIGLYELLEMYDKQKATKSKLDAL